jgi:hypothetical protein
MIRHQDAVGLVQGIIQSMPLLRIFAVRRYFFAFQPVKFFLQFRKAV